MEPLFQDRHNGNILCDSEGHIIHIDFGFMLSTSPGELGFEAAPFKLSRELVDVMRDVDGPESEAGGAELESVAAAGLSPSGSDKSVNTFSYFESLCVQGFLAARRQFHRLALLLQTAKEGAPERHTATLFPLPEPVRSKTGPELPCFVGGMTGGQTVLEDFRHRFVLAMSDQVRAERLAEPVGVLSAQCVECRRWWTTCTSSCSGASTVGERCTTTCVLTLKTSPAISTALWWASRRFSRSSRTASSEGVRRAALRHNSSASSCGRLQSNPATRWPAGRLVCGQCTCIKSNPLSAQGPPAQRRSRPGQSGPAM